MPLLIPSERAAILSAELDYAMYQSVVKRLERKIQSYRYPRRAPENLESDRRQLAQMKGFDPRFARLSAENPELTLRRAKEMEQESLGRSHRTRKERRKSR